MNKIIKELANDYVIYLVKHGIKLDVNQILRLENTITLAYLEGGSVALNELGREINK